jgi:CRISPR-associated protein Csy2
MNYVTIALRASKTSMLQNLSILSPAPVFAAVMAMHALNKKIHGGLGLEGVGLIHHNAQPWVEHLEDKGYLQSEIVQRRGAVLFDSAPNPSANPMQPMALADLEWTILLACNLAGNPAEIENTLLTMRFAGGDVRSASVRCFEDMDEALRSIRSGFWIDDDSDVLAGADDPMAALLQAQRSAPWRVPANLGYALLEPPASRQGAREGYPHAFAEHMIGLLRYTPMHQAREAISLANLWRYGWDADQFLVTNRPHVSLSPSCFSSI